MPAAKEENDVEALPAAVLPPAPRSDVEAEVEGDEVVIVLGDRRYRIRGLARNPSFDALKVNLLVSREAFDGVGQAMHVDTLRPLPAAPAHGLREAGGGRARREGRRGEGRPREDPAQARIAAGGAARGGAGRLKRRSSSSATRRRKAALELLEDPDLLARIERDFTRCGVVGEATNKLVGYLAGVSRKLDAPLAIVTLQSTSAAGKSALMDAVLGLHPRRGPDRSTRR